MKIGMDGAKPMNPSKEMGENTRNFDTTRPEQGAFNHSFSGYNGGSTGHDGGSFFKKYSSQIGALVLLIITSGMIMINALYLQPGKHPAPILAGQTVKNHALTNEEGNTINGDYRLSTASIPTDAISNEMIEQSYEEQIFTPESSNELTQESTNELTRESANELTSEFEKLQTVETLQKKLKSRGYYQGEIDGLSGPETASAIRAYERDNELQETGQPSESLIVHLKFSKDRVIPIPTRPERVREQKVSIAELSAKDTITRIASVQRALTKLGYGKLDIDGVTGPKTKEAIRKFEAEHGFPITGNINDRLLKELIIIGSLSLD